MQLFPTQAITELAQEFKLLRKDIQAIRNSLERIEKSLSSTNPQLKS
jgi:prefoldin subunit 5